jgi:hypothetical protein
MAAANKKKKYGGGGGELNISTYNFATQPPSLLLLPHKEKKLALLRQYYRAFQLVKPHNMVD